jgi:hypothetical protein
MTVCPDCGAPVRYIPASPSAGNGIFMVDEGLISLVGERGYIIRGYQTHTCKGVADGNQAENKAESKKTG